MQPRQRSKCSTTVSVSSIDPSTSPLHQIDPSARRVHLLVPERVRRARRQAEAAVDAVGDQLGLHIASSDALGERAPRAARAPSRRTRRAGPGRTSGAAPARPSARAPGQARLQRAQLVPRLGLARRRARANCASTARCDAFEEHVHASVGDVDRARHELRAVQRLPARGAGDDRARGSRQRMQPQREPLDAPEPPARAAEELRRGRSPRRSSRPCRPSRPRAVRQHDRDADHEVAHRPEPVAQRAGEIVEQAVRERRVARRVEREPLPVPASACLQRRQADAALDDAGQVAGLVLDDPRSEALCKPGQSRAGGRGTAPAPRRRAAASGRACPGLASPCGSKALRKRCIAARSASLNISGIAHALSVPTPCSPVIEPPASTHASRIGCASSSARAACALDRVRRRGRAGAGCRRRRGRRCRRAGRALATARRCGAAPRQARARHDAVLHVVVRADPAHRGERRLPSAPHRRPVGRVGRRCGSPTRRARGRAPRRARDPLRPARPARRARRSGPRRSRADSSRRRPPPRPRS